MVKPPNLPRVTTVVLLYLVVTAMISFGGVLGETVMLYPNIFRDPPASLELTREFMVAGSPSDFFPPLGLSISLSAAVGTLLAWRSPARWWIAAATVVFVLAEFLFSAWFFWPRNTIMFVDPVGTHSADYLRQVAAEFNAGHWVRVAGGALTSGLAFTGFLRWYRLRTGTATAPARSPATGQ
ncbi:hypothetical protein Sru01_30090 [Sphaerisporangium rufum]|uniref:DUF1772 domain-containing protein n=1 Tax=Sphaerisporangium rufum TaxID=1381558 RepID=A0A919V0Z4_9ACTN|nr:DUF1772 domain-containing protein [Sphaerisporangium rufum]GII78027.1 hypothetical protein Sru01_30090 [Sphaerisporangium rufum]